MTRQARSSPTRQEDSPGDPKLAEAIKKFRADTDMTQEQLGARIGVSKGFISGLENQRWGARVDTLQALAEVMGRPLEDLLSGGSNVNEGSTEDRTTPARTVKHPEHQLDPAKYVFVRRYAAIGGLGGGRMNDQHVEISGSFAYRLDLILKRGWRPEALAVIEAEGPSMEPTINDGDVVLINMDETQIVSGQIYAIEDPDHGTRIKRLHKLLDGRVRVVSDNPDKRLYPDDYLTPDGGARIIGRAVERGGSL